MGADNCVQTYSQQNGNWQTNKQEKELYLPVRQGSLGGELFNLAGTLPAGALLFPGLPACADNEITGQRDEQEEILLVQIKNLMEEKRSLTFQLKNKEEALSQYRQMLELTHSGVNQQRSEWKAAAVKLEERTHYLETQYRRYAEENKTLKEQLAEQKRQHAAAENIMKERETELRDTVAQLQQDLKRKKRVWENIYAIFQKKE